MNKETLQLKKEFVDPYVDGKDLLKVRRGEQYPSWEEVVGVVSRKGSTELESKTRVSYQQAAELYNTLPAKARQFLRETGKAQATGWWCEEQGKTLEPHRRAPDSRGVKVLQMYLEQQGRCPLSGVRLSGPGFFAVDHVVPLGQTVDGVLGTDEPSNWLLLGAVVNSQKKQKTVDQYVAHVSKFYSAGKDAYSEILKASNEYSKIRTRQRNKIKSLRGKEQVREYVLNQGGWSMLHQKEKQYLGRYHMDIRQLGTIRVTPTGLRTGGDQRKYFLNAFREEWVFGDENLAISCYRRARQVDNDYVSGKISLKEYCRQLFSIASETTTGPGTSLESFYAKVSKKLPESTKNFHQGE